jgi:hypothetical protein
VCPAADNPSTVVLSEAIMRRTLKITCVIPRPGGPQAFSLTDGVRLVTVGASLLGYHLEGFGLGEQRTRDLQARAEHLKNGHSLRVGIGGRRRTGAAAPNASRE